MTSSTDGVSALPIAASATPTMQQLVYDAAQPEGARAQRLVAGMVSKLLATAIPFIIAPTGTMAANGAITLGTALPTIYANCYLNLPANAIQAGSAAGWYYAQMSSTTLGTVFLNNTYTSGVPLIPTNPVAPTTTGPGAYTGVTTAQTAVSGTLPAGAMGPNGALRFYAVFGCNNSAGNKTISLTFGGQTVFASIQTTNLSFRAFTEIQNQGIATSQVMAASGLPGGGGNAQSYTAVNTANAQTVTASMTLAVATDFVILDIFTVELIPG